MPLTYGRRLAALAAERPDGDALIFEPAAGPAIRLTFGTLEARSNQLARLLQSHGAGSGSVVAIGLPNSPEFVLACFAAWKLGACVLPIPAAAPPAERSALLEAARSSGSAIVTIDEGAPEATLRATDLARAAGHPADPLPDVVSNPGRAIPSGGSTGRPKIITEARPWVVGLLPPGETDPFGRRAGDTVLIGGPLYHAAPFGALFPALCDGGPVVLMDRFEAARFVELVRRHTVSWTFLVPTQMLRILRLEGMDRACIPSLRAIYHAAAPCPDWVKRGWIDLLGPEGVHEVYASAERIGATFIRGDEWLERPGSVGRAGPAEIRVLDESGRDVPPGVVGQVFLRWKEGVTAGYLAPGSDPHEMCRYWGAGTLTTTADGFASANDLGWLDAAGYLYIADRRSDMIVTGGANVYPAEVEGVLSGHPRVRDVAVVGLPDPEWGRRVHAIVEADACEGLAGELQELARRSLSAYKLPKSYEVVPRLPRSEAGKIRRSALADERSAAGPAGGSRR